MTAKDTGCRDDIYGESEPRSSGCFGRNQKIAFHSSRGVRKLVSPANLANCRPISCQANFIKPSCVCRTTLFVPPMKGTAERSRPASDVYILQLFITSYTRVTRAPSFPFPRHFPTIFSALHVFGPNEAKTSGRDSAGLAVGVCKKSTPKKWMYQLLRLEYPYEYLIWVRAL